MPVPQKQRKPGSKGPDPAQKQLRVNKKMWSKETSALIDSMIEFKKGLNGQGSTVLNIPPSRIHLPLPSEVNSALNQLSADFQSVLSGANSIINQQSEYSQKRPKPKPKKQKAPSVNIPSQEPQPMEPNRDQVVQQLSQLANEEYMIKKEASKPWSRGWEYFKSFLPFREKLNKERIGLLSSTASLFYAILDLENDILTLNISSIPSVVSKYQIVRYHLDTLKGSIENAESELRKTKPANQQSSINSEPASSSVSHTPFDQNKLISDFKRVIHNIMQEYGWSPELAITTDFLSAMENQQDPHFKAKIKDDLMHHYDIWIKKLEQEHGSEEVGEVIHRKAESSNNEIVKLAHNPITRFLRRQWAKVRKTNRTAVHRLRIISIIDDIKKSLHKMMDSLENNIDVKVLLKEIENIDSYFEAIKNPLSTLNVMYREKFYKEQRERLKDRKDDPLQDWILKRKVRKELQQDLF